MSCFVIASSVDGGKTILDYLAENGYQWTESGALAKWFHSEEEAQEFLDALHLVRQGVSVKPYDPIQTMLHPTTIDRDAVIQNELRKMLDEGPVPVTSSKDRDPRFRPRNGSCR